MGITKARLRRIELLKNFHPEAFVMDEEPELYSHNSPLPGREVKRSEFRNRKFYSMIRCVFLEVKNLQIPIVVIVRFFLTPPAFVKLSKKQLKADNIPALECMEICDYLLSFLELLNASLLQNYRQIVKIDAEKYYSDCPRTVFKFLTWDQYVNFQNKVNNNPEGESVGKTGSAWSLQSKRKGYDATQKPSKVEAGRSRRPSVFRTDSGDFALSDPSTAFSPHIMAEEIE